MGAFLDKPKTEKHTERFDGKGMRGAISSMQGWRIEHEDAHVAELELKDNKDASWFAVFDGHGGSLVAQECAKRVHPKIDVSSLDVSTLKRTMRDAFLSLDTELRELEAVSRGDDHSGSTAITTLVTPNHVICANVGDSRAIMIRDGKVVELSHDHKPINPNEKNRIEKAGGSVMMNRVNGDLAVSRAMGDFCYKTSDSLPAEEQQVSPEPEFIVVDRDDSKDQYLVLACDGIWDVMSNEAVCDWVLKKVDQGADDMGDLSEDLLDECLELGSRDNMSVIIVALKAASRPDANKIKEYKASRAQRNEYRRQTQQSAEPQGGPGSAAQVLSMLQQGRNAQQ